jgi:hypothetical protein
MYELTKKRRVSDAVANVFPEAVLKNIWDIITLMSKNKALVSSPVAVVFADDFTDDEFYAMLLQGDAAAGQEFPIAFTGEKPFLGHGYILIIKDRPKTVTMEFSAVNEMGDEPEAEEAEAQAPDQDDK